MWTATTFETSRVRPCAGRSASCSRRASSSQRPCARTSPSAVQTPSDAEVEAAARAAGAHDFIEQLPNGYETVVGERGLTLSGGQRQRLALARALLCEPRILLLDDATSAIDAKVEEAIHSSLRDIMRGRTTLLVAHRRSSLHLADRIVVVDGGHVVDQGTDEELLGRCALYRSMSSGDEPQADVSMLRRQERGRRRHTTGGAPHAAGGPDRAGAPPGRTHPLCLPASCARTGPRRHRGPRSGRLALEPRPLARAPRKSGGTQAGPGRCASRPPTRNGARHHILPLPPSQALPRSTRPRAATRPLRHARLAGGPVPRAGRNRQRRRGRLALGAVRRLGRCIWPWRSRISWTRSPRRS